jgi:hypothetical protein
VEKTFEAAGKREMPEWGGGIRVERRRGDGLRGHQRQQGGDQTGAISGLKFEIEKCRFPRGVKK